MKKVFISLIILILIVTGLILIFKKNENINNDNLDKISIVTTIYPIYDFTREIAGDKANVSMLLSPGVEIHDYEPTPQDIIKIQNSKLFLYLGENLEPWAKTIVSGNEKQSNIKNIAENIEIMKLEEENNHHEEEFDTHIWLDPQKSVQIVKNITDELCEADPINANYYKNRAEEYILRLEKLDEEFEEVVQASSKKEIAFGGPFSYSYFIKRYNLNYVSAYDSCGENGEPSIDKVLEVVKEVKEKDLPVIFYKELSSGNIAKTISDETGAKMLEFNSLHSITNDQLQDGTTYMDIMYKNLENLKEALQ